MSPYKRNLLVGVTVLLSFAVLGWMIIQFGGKLASPFSGEHMTVTIDADRANALSIGSPVQFLGVTVGQISRLELTDDYGVILEASIDASVKIPANVVGDIRQTNLLSSGAVVQLEVDETPQGQLQAGAIIPTRYTGNKIIPDEIGDLAGNLNELVISLKQAGVVDETITLLHNANAQVTRAGDTMASLQRIIDDPQLRADLKDSFANARETTQRAKVAVENFEKVSNDLQGVGSDISDTVAEANATVADAHKNINDISRQLAGRLEKLDGVLDNVQSITAKIDHGEGTAGKLVNDPDLYIAVLDVLGQVKAVSSDTQRLIEQLEQEGFKVGF